MINALSEYEFKDNFTKNQYRLHLRKEKENVIKVIKLNSLGVLQVIHLRLFYIDKILPVL
jgi:hypothetical protein